ncbi:PEP-utilizing enzyme, mobile domain protein [delta proteobacterium NaphS2]|nr:PEP-utilizing enzyme, mobile domain protein [delta proteobacterium NaphS2]
MKNGNTSVLLVATMDTKLEEAFYVDACLRKGGVTPIIMDGGIRSESPAGVAVTRSDVIRASGKTLNDIMNCSSEGAAMDAMVNGATRCALDMYSKGEIDGIIALGGTMGTTLGTGVMRAFPLGFPKVMITTLGSQDTRNFVGSRDILMLNSVSDLAGLNRITERVLHNGANAILAMSKVRYIDNQLSKPLAFLTTMGPLEASAAALRRRLGKLGFEVVTFHSIGTGGEAMEKMISEESVDVVVDLSLHELTSRHFGGAFDAGPNRCKAAIRAGIPTVLVPGSMDFLASGPLDQTKKSFPGRKYHKHNAHFSAVGTTPDELRKAAEILAERCNEGTGPIAMLVPMKGFSEFGREGHHLFDPAGPPAFAEAFRKAIKRDIHFECLPYHINDDAFVDAIETALHKMVLFRKARGGAASQGVVRGEATVISDIEDVFGINDGTILVCPTISRTLIPIIPKLKGLVTDRGGILSIASEFARKNNIPTVVGATNFSKTVKTSQIIEVNGTEGTVEIIQPGAHGLLN